LNRSAESAYYEHNLAEIDIWLSPQDFELERLTLSGSELPTSASLGGATGIRDVRMDLTYSQVDNVTISVPRVP
jgi:hypothetical protein